MKLFLKFIIVAALSFFAGSGSGYLYYSGCQKTVIKLAVIPKSSIVNEFRKVKNGNVDIDSRLNDSTKVKKKFRLFKKRVNK